MAFRSHEINLMLRVQDRASGRLRRVANDLGGVSRAAQLQNKAAQLQKAQAGNLNNQIKLRSNLMSKLNSQSLESINHERQLFDLTTKRMQLLHSKHDNPIIHQRQLLAVENQILDLNQKRNREIDEINRALARGVALEKAQRIEAEKLAAAQAIANKRASQIRHGRNLMHGGSAAGFIGAAGLAVSAGLSGGAANFNRQATRAATQLRGPGESLGSAEANGRKLERTILGLSRVFPASMTEMADSAYELASGMTFVSRDGQRAANSQERLARVTDLLTIANKAAVAGGIDLESATDSMIVTLNNFGPRMDGSRESLIKTNEVMNTLFATVQYGKGTFDEFSPVFGSMSAGAKVANQSLKDAGGAVAFLSQKMASQSQAVVGYTNLLSVLQRPDTRAGFKAMFGVGINVPGTNKLRPLQQLIAIMLKANPELAKGGFDSANILQRMTAMGDVALGAKTSKGNVSTKTSRTALQQLLMGWKDYAITLKEVQTNTDAFDKSYEQMGRSPGVRWQVAINQFKAFAIVIGQNVLPSMLRLMAFVQGLAHRYEALSPSLKRAIGLFTVISSLILFVGGTIGILAGGILTLIGTFGMLESKMAFISKAMTALGAIGSISLIFHAAITGEADAKTLLAGAIAGGMFGARFGVAGAAIGAITVPIIMTVVADKKKKNWKEWAAGSWLTGAHDFITGGTNRDWHQPELPKATKKQMQEINGQTTFGLTDLTSAHKVATANILNDWQQLTSDLTGLQYLGGLTKQTLNGVNDISLAFAKAQSTGNEAATVKAAKDMIKWLDQQEASLLKLKKLTPEQKKQLKQYYEQEAQMRGIVTSAANKQTAETKKETAAQERANKAKEAAVTRLENAKQKVEQLKLSLQSLREQELSKLQSAFGNLFQGPILSGPLGNIFTNINSTLAGFGIKPIAVPIDLILKDQQSQQASFDALTKGLDKITPKIPEKFRNAFTEQVMSMGTGAVPFLESLMGAPGSKRNKFIQNFVKSQKSLDKATKSPWQMQLTAADIQYKSALLQWKAAGGKLTKAEKGVVNAGKKPGAVKPVPTSTTRTTQGVTHYNGDNITVRADGATPGAVTAALNKGQHAKKYTRRF